MQRETTSPDILTSRQSDLVVVTGFGIKGIDEFVKACKGRIPFVNQKIIHGCLPEHAKEHPDRLIDLIEDKLDQGQREQTVVGHSYGALLALAACCRRQLAGVSHLFLIDGPLNPNAEVNPPVDGRFNQFQQHYILRRKTASDCVRALNAMPVSERRKVVTMGNEKDAIVHSGAKCLHMDGIRHFDLGVVGGHSLFPDKIEEVVKIISREIGAKSAV